MSLVDSLRSALLSLSDDSSASDSTMNKQLKLLEIYIDGLTTTAEKCRILLKASGPYQELCSPLLLKAFEVLGFKDTESSWVFDRPNADLIVSEKDAVVKLIGEFRRLSLEEVSQYVQRGEKPPGIREVDDRAVDARHSEAKLQPQRRPWENQPIESFDFPDDPIPTDPPA